MKKLIQYTLIALFSMLSTPSFATLGNSNSQTQTSVSMQPTAQQNWRAKFSKSEKSARLWKRIFALGGLGCLLGAVFVTAGSTISTVLFGGAVLCFIMFFIAYRFF